MLPAVRHAGDFSNPAAGKSRSDITEHPLPANLAEKGRHVLQRTRTLKPVLTIAGFDPSSGAGVTADLMVFAAHGLFGLSCITALTVQSTQGVKATQPVAAEIIRDTLACLEDDMPAAGIKIGMLATTRAVDEVAEFLTSLRQRGRNVPVVLDPVLRSTSGRELLEPAGIGRMQRLLLPLVDWVTPNLDELSVLDHANGCKLEDPVAAARRLQQSCPNLNVVVTGGHLPEPVDLLVTAAGEVISIAGERIDSISTHGTGCAYSSALLSYVVLGDAPVAAVRAAKQYVAQAIRSASPIGRGIGPLRHLWPLDPAPHAK